MFLESSNDEINPTGAWYLVNRWSRVLGVQSEGRIDLWSRRYINPYTTLSRTERRFFLRRRCFPTSSAILLPKIKDYGTCVTRRVLRVSF